jgi:hypothetical protein
MRWSRGAGVVCSFKTEGEEFRSVWGHVGSIGGLQLGERGSGECERVQQGALLVNHHRERVGLLQGI